MRAVVADVRSLPFADAAFDVAVSNSTPNDFATRDDVLTGLREVARIHGRRVVAFPYSAGIPFARWKNACRKWSRDSARYQRRKLDHGSAAN